MALTEKTVPAWTIPDDIRERGEQELIRLGELTAGQLIRQGLVPCEVNPRTGGLSRTGDPAHALAAFTITGRGFESRHICRECAMEFYANRPIREGIHWS